jgi:hypothetical protein
MDYSALLDAASAYAQRLSIVVATRELAATTAAEFDGSSVTLNRQVDEEWRAYYLVHSLGSVVAWRVDSMGVRAMFHELRDAKTTRQTDPGRLAKAVDEFRAFEIRASEYGVQILNDIDAAWVIPSFSLFFRADLESITMFHRDGRAPVWKEFLARWRSDVAAGLRELEPFSLRTIPDVPPVAIERQEVLLERGGHRTQ